jgi:hypothetical protein
VLCEAKPLGTGGKMIVDQEDYLQLLDLTFRVANSLKGKPAPNHRIPDCNKLAQKLYYHAATVYWLNQGTNAPTPTPEGTYIFDFASVAVVTRAILETYLTMYELFFEPISEDEQEFRHTYWLLSGFVIREKYVSDRPSAKKSFGGLLHEIEELRLRIQKTSHYATLTEGTKKRCLAGDMPNKAFEKRLEAAGFAPKFTLRAHRYLSGFAHSDGLVAIQITQAKSEEDQKKYIRSYMHMIMMVMSKMILSYKKMFPSAEAWCMAKPEILRLAEIWSDTTRRLDA